MKRFPRWTALTRRVLLTGAVAATILAAAWIEENIRGERSYRAFEEACAESGQPLDYAFYQPASVPDAANMFRAPVLVRFFNAKPDDRVAWITYEKENHPSTR